MNNQGKGSKEDVILTSIPMNILNMIMILVCTLILPLAVFVYGFSQTARPVVRLYSVIINCYVYLFADAEHFI